MKHNVTSELKNPSDGSFQTWIIDFEKTEWLLGKANTPNQVPHNVKSHLYQHGKKIPLGNLIEYGQRHVSNFYTSAILKNSPPRAFDHKPYACTSVSKIQ
jgi:hypothetical protein